MYSSLDKVSCPTCYNLSNSSWPMCLFKSVFTHKTRFGVWIGVCPCLRSKKKQQKNPYTFLHCLHSFKPFFSHRLALTVKRKSQRRTWQPHPPPNPPIPFSTNATHSFGTCPHSAQIQKHRLHKCMQTMHLLSKYSTRQKSKECIPWCNHCVIFLGGGLGAWMDASLEGRVEGTHASYFKRSIGIGYGYTYVNHPFNHHPSNIHCILLYDH